MPIQPTYPGVYIEEIPSGVRTITGVATSVTAFVGRTQRGPTNTPMTISSIGDFNRLFGGLWIKSALGFAVSDFYRNGGSQAIVVRLDHDGAAAKLRLPGAEEDELVLEVANPGEWGNALRARVDHEVSAEVAASYGLTDKLFNLTVRDMATGTTEQIRNVTFEAGHARSLDKVLENSSSLVRVSALSSGLPVATDAGLQPAQLRVAPFSGPSDPRSVGVADADRGNDGGALTASDFTGAEREDAKQGIYALEKADTFNILCIPPYTDVDTALNEDASVEYNPVITDAANYCERRRAFLIVDPDPGWNDKNDAKTGVGEVGTSSKNAALFFPRLRQPNPLRANQIESFAPCGAVAGVFARTDSERGVWKAPAGVAAELRGVSGLSVPLTDFEIGELNPLGINCLRNRPPAGRVVWGTRTLQGDDRRASEWKYISVRRLALYIEESLYRGTDWVVFEPNGETLWAQIRLNIGAFMHNLFRQGAFKGTSRQEAYFVKCDKETTTDNDINLGIVNVVVGFAPLKPAEFLILKIQQIAGQIEA
jgi:phage tail sheath protein FI